MSEHLNLIWQRPESPEYPKIWRKFEIKKHDAVVEYVIQDLPESRFEYAVEFMIQVFCSDEPLTEAYEVTKDAEAIEYFRTMYKSLLRQKMTLVCFKKGSDEIAGISVNYVKFIGEQFWEELDQKFGSAKTDRISEIIAILEEKFDVFKQYGVDKYLDSQSIAVNRRYRGRGIAEQFLRCSKTICDEFGLKVTASIFTSDFSNQVADKVGFKLEKSIRYEDLRTTHPHLNIPNIQSEAMTIKSLYFDDS